MRQHTWKRLGIVVALTLGGGGLSVPAAADTIFLQDGRTLQADTVEVLGDRVRLERAGGETIELPKSQVLSVHTPRPAAPPRVPPPAVYPNFVEQMTDRVRSQLTGGLTTGPAGPTLR